MTDKLLEFLQKVSYRALIFDLIVMLLLGGILGYTLSYKNVTIECNEYILGKFYPEYKKISSNTYIYNGNEIKTNTNKPFNINNDILPDKDIKSLEINYTD